jgi:hypothetical protein
MYFQIYLNHNSNGEDITFLKNFCTTLNLKVENLHTNKLIQPTTINKYITNKAKNLTNIIIVWGLENKETDFATVQEFCTNNLLNYVLLYHNNNTFFENPTHQTIKKQHTITVIQNTQNSNTTELYSNLLKHITNKTELEIALQPLEKGHLLEL